MGGDLSGGGGGGGNVEGDLGGKVFRGSFGDLRASVWSKTWVGNV